jgi:hypothetical protein
MGLGVYEHHVGDGKRHALYGSLEELREMLVECVDAAASLAGKPAPSPTARHGSDPPQPVPADLKQTIAYDVESTVRLFNSKSTEAERALAAELPGGIGPQILDAATRHDVSFLDAETWGEVHNHLLSNFRLGDPAWEALVFRLWLTRVLAYTTNQAAAGYDKAMDYLESTIAGYESSTP